MQINVNQKVRTVASAPDTPLLYVLSDELQLHGPRFGCGLAQCGSCSVLIDGVEKRSCVTPMNRVGMFRPSLLVTTGPKIRSQRKMPSA